MQHNQGTQHDPDYPYPKPDPKHVFGAWVFAFAAIGLMIIYGWCSAYIIIEKDFWTVFIGGSVSWLILMAMLFQIKIADTQAEITKLQYQQARELFIISERAYIGLDEVPSVNLQANKSIELLVNLVNTGKTPARQLEVNYSHGYGIGWSDSWSDQIKVVFDPFSNTIITPCALPGKNAIIIHREAIDADTIKSIAWGFLVWYIRVAINYTDFQKTAHTDTFFVMFHPENGFQWNVTKPLTGKFYGIHLPDEAYKEEQAVN